jgi:predicted nucleic acid-binding protein
MRIYNNLEELDRDIKYLKLQQQVHKETMKLNVNELKESFSAVSIMTNIIGSIAKKAVILKAVNKLIGSRSR